MPKKQAETNPKSVWRFNYHGAPVLYGYGTHSLAVAHCAEMNAHRHLNHWDVRQIDVEPARFRSMVRSGVIFDLEERLKEDGKRRIQNFRDALPEAHPRTPRHAFGRRA